MTRHIYQIAYEISKEWEKPYFGAVPYLQAMKQIATPEDFYGQDNAKTIVLYFLSNATTWRGEKARAIKRELKTLCKI